ncbi:MAG: Spy/CpxP family protein refolding chaperone [Candidatus Melainabacteria bacterium]
MKQFNILSLNLYFKLLANFVLVILINQSLVSYSRGMDEALAQLNLSETQKQQIEQIQNDKKIQIKSFQADIKVTQDKLNSLLGSDLSSEQEINNLKNQIDLNQSKISDLKTKSWKQIRAILTPDQEARLREYKFAQ